MTFALQLVSRCLLDYYKQLLLAYLLQLEWVKECKELKDFSCVIRQISDDKNVRGDG